MDLPVLHIDILETAELIAPYIHKTPVFSSQQINSICGADVFFKCENLQKAGSFKIRGATNAVLRLSEKDQKKGVVTHSSGNFAQALALSARQNNIPAYIVMPENAPQVKIDAVRGYGAEIRFCPNTQEMREKTMKEWQSETGATFLHPYDNLHVIMGQGTSCFELIEQVSDLDSIISPVGGGGLVSGTALSAHYFLPGTKVYAAEPEGADDAWHSFNEGRIFPSNNPNTIADGLLTSLGEHTFPIIRQLVEDVILVSDAEIAEAMKLIWTRMKIVVEPSSATTLAVILKNKELFADKRVGCILSGGNVDVNKLPF